MNTRITDYLKTRSATTVCVQVLALSLLVYGSWVCGGQRTVTLDFESVTPGSATPPDGWSYVDSGLGASGTYSNSASGGGSMGVGIGGTMQSGYDGKLPHSFLVNSGTKHGFYTSEPITGTYDFKKLARDSNYDSTGFLFGDIKNGSISGTNAGQLLLIYHSRGGYGQAGAESAIVNGANVALNYADTSNPGFNEGNWYRMSFTWTPTNGTTGDLTCSSSNWNGSAWVAHASFGATGHVFSTETAYIGFCDLRENVAEVTVDNIIVTGSVPPSGTVISIK